MDTKSDIVLCNGFVGNITLKMIEGLSKFLISQLSNSVRSIDIYKLKNDFNFELSTLLLGINGIVLKCHGSSSQESFKSAINEARNLFESNITTNINKYFQK
jgi:glycerol-3-phosphate acyltransferase PlsX